MFKFDLPPVNHPSRGYMDFDHIREVLDAKNIDKLASFRSAIIQARNTLKNCQAAKGITIVCIRHDDERWLIKVGRRGGWKCLWNFGKGE